MSNVQTPAYDLFRKKLRQARLAAGLTQAEAAKRMRKPQSFIAKCENGDRRMDFIELQAFAKLYKKPLGYFEASAVKNRRGRV